MKISQTLLATLREAPVGTCSVSHQFMLRAGLIRQVATGLYSWLPIGLRVLRRIESLVRQTLDNAGAVELSLPFVQPFSLWEETGRSEAYGAELLRFQDRHLRSLVLGPTHEEVITDLLRRELTSYKQLPLLFYQIQLKFRDERRPRAGVIRGREFVMKDAYSFHLTTDSLNETYEKVRKAYLSLFSQMSLNFKVVAASAGAIGGNLSHEFQALVSSGEDAVVFSRDGSYCTKLESAEGIPAFLTQQPPIPTAAPAVTTTPNYPRLALHLVRRAGSLGTGALLQDWVGLLLHESDEYYPAQLAELAPVATPFRPATREEQAALLPSDLVALLQQPPEGFEILVDHSLMQLTGFSLPSATGWVEPLCWHRDIPDPASTHALRMVQTGDEAPNGSGPVEVVRSTELGHIFQLGQRYSDPMSCTVQTQQGPVALQMGCYGIGISRLVATIIEQHHDEQGIIWPRAVAPFEVHLLPLNTRRAPEVARAAAHIYQTLRDADLKVLLDDRDERPGVMFSDALLIGIPDLIVITDKLLATQQVEYQARRKPGEKQLIPIEELAAFLTQQQSIAST